MNIDRRTLDLAAPVLSTLASLVSLVVTLRSGDRSKASALSALLGVVGSAAWAMSAVEEQRSTLGTHPAPEARLDVT